MKLFITIFAVIALYGGCKNNTGVAGDDLQTGKVITKEEQSKLTPDKVIETLKKGNEAFAGNNLRVQNSTERVHNAAEEQYPEAIILSCIDSRVPVEDIFQCGIGDIFVARVAGNIVNPDILGSMEYACKVSGSKLVVVLGHGNCGAIKSVLNEVELGNITGLLEKIKPALSESKENYSGETKSSNHDFVETVCHTNVKLMVNEIRKNSPILKEMEDNGEIKIVGAMYDIHTGKVDFFENM